MISFIILTRGRPALLAECLDSLEAAGAPGRTEVLIGINGGTPAEALALRAARPWSEVFLLERVSRGEGRNQLVKKSRGDAFYFLDDDTSVPSDFLIRLESALVRNPGAGVIGGPNLRAEDSSPFQRAVDFLLRSPLGAGPMRRRYAAVGGEGERGGAAFMLSGLLVRRGVFANGVWFDSKCSSAEENLLIHDAAASFGPGIYCPELLIRHHRRAGWTAFLAQVFVNGRGRGEITRLRPTSFHPAALAPVVLCAVAISAVSGSRAADATTLVAYGTATLLEMIRMAFSEEGGVRAAWRLPFLFPLAHASYALGLLTGLVRGSR